MSVFHNNALIGSGGGAAAVADLNITKSLRFNAGDTAYLNRTPSSAGNRRTFTFACWFKLVETSGTRRYLFSAASANTGSPYNWILGFAVLNGQLTYTNAANDIYKTDAVLRDFSAWYHCVFAVDTTQATASDRVKIYLNGALMDITDQNHGGADPPSQNTEYPINNTTAHAVGAVWNHQNTDLSGYFNGYIADAYLIDGSALDPTSFGAYDDNGVWQASTYSGTYGTNGFHLLDFENESTLGHDSSGNNNDFTANNLVETVVVPNQGFDCVTYTGNGGTQSITGLSFQPDLVWIKLLDASGYSHKLVDSVRGATKSIVSNNTNAELTEANGLTSFNSNGFSLGSQEAYNKSGNSFIAWCWKAGGASVSNADGTITSSVSANNTYGFSIIKHTGTNAAGTFGHGLNSAPKFMIFKNLEATDNWFVWHTSFGSATTGAVLNSTNDFFTNGTNELNSTEPTASVIHVGSNLATNGNNQEIITYAWSEVAGFSKFGSYTGNGSTSGPSVTGLGFKPRWVLIKGDLDGEDWVIVDTVRSPTNPNKKLIAPNSSAQEFTHPSTAYDMDIDDDGFTVKNTNPRWNSNGKTYIWAAFGSGSGDPGGLDVLFDVPTNGDQTDTGAGGEVSGNYATFNPLNATGSGLSNGNLDLNGSSNFIQSTIMVDSGKYYFEFTKNGNGDNQFGIAYGGSSASSTGFRRVWRDNNGSPVWLTDGSNAGSGTALSCAVGDVIGVALDMDNNAVYFSKNGTYMNSGNPTSGSSKTGAIWTDLSGQSWGPNAGSNANGVDCSLNTGARAFAYNAPSGFKALCTTNLPTPTIADGRDYFDAKLWTGNSTDQRAITGYQFSPDWVWIKRRNASYAHPVMDTVRGLNSGHAGVLYTNQTNAEDTGPTSSIRSFNSDGFNLGTDGGVNFNGSTYVGWAWDAGSSTVSNTDGSITASVRANQTAGLSIVKYTGQSGGGSWGHGLSAAPDFILFKRYTSAQNWFTWFREADGTYLEFEGINDPRAAFSSRNNVTATSTTITLPNQAEYTNDTSSSYIAYCVSNVSSYSQAGFYNGNGSADGTFVFTNFAVRFLMIKQTNDSNGWFIWDTARDSLNPNTALFSANATNAEQSQANHAIDFLSNGFKARDSNGAFNSSSGEYAYLAFASNPFQANGGLAR